MATAEERLMELEIRYTHQEQLLEELSTELYKANERIDELTARLRLYKQSVDALVEAEPLPPDEKPPHY